MSIEIISGDEAWRNLVGNKTGKWPVYGKEERLYPVATPSTTPKFQIQPSDRIFCIGSCFAREIEQALKRLNFEVTSIIRDLPQSENRKGADAGMFNKYTIASILNELKWVLDPSTPYSDDAVLVENASGLYEDYQLSGSNYSDTLANASAFRAAFNRSYAAIKDADVVVVTLGLSEAWLDRSTGLYLNVAPSRHLVKKHPGRFELVVLDYEESLSKLEELYALLQDKLKPGFRMLITVSPVPLLATFRDQDVLVANAYSKAVLRAAVEKFHMRKSNVSYFPSYEFVTLSNPTTVWGDVDYRHVDRYFVEHIMGSVVARFCNASPEQLAASAMAKASALYRAKFYAEAAETLRPMMANLAEVSNAKMVLRWGMIHRQLGDVQAAREAYKEYLRRCPDDEKAKAVLSRL